MQLESRIVSHSNDVQKGSLKCVRKEEREGDKGEGEKERGKVGAAIYFE